MVAAATFAVPGSLDTPTGGYAYDRRVIVELRALGWSVDVIDLGEGFPDPAPGVRAAALRAAAEHPGEGPLVVDGLALGVLPELPVLLAGGRPVVALVHHPLALETGNSREHAAMLAASEKAALAGTPGVIVTSAATADILVADFDVARSRITVAPPGVARPPRARGSGREAPALLAVGALVPRKGHDVLLAALAGLRERPWTLAIVGDDGRSPETARALRRQAAQAGLADRVEFTGAIGNADLAERYDFADIFLLASRFEGYGMAYAEAIACGLPVVGTAAGAVPATVPPGCGLLVAPDDAAALAGALEIALADANLRARWADTAWGARAGLPSWQETGRLIADALRTAE